MSLEAKAKADALLVQNNSQEKAAKLKPVKWNKTAGHHESISDLMRKIHNGLVPDGFKVRKSGFLGLRSFGFDRSSIVDGISSKVFTHLDSENIEALVIELTNTNVYSHNPSVNKDQWGDYIALAFSTDNIAPSGTGFVYIIRPRTAGQ